MVITYSCVCHSGKIRTLNQDNYFVNGVFRSLDGEDALHPISGIADPEKQPIFGVFDGMGGEECGEVASLIAAQSASEIASAPISSEVLADYCFAANDNICRFAHEHNVNSMGTTAALVVFTPTRVDLCNIGDSRIFRLHEGQFAQVSMDHLAAAPYGKKAPLYQCLGIDPSEMKIEPYLAEYPLTPDDMYLLCSDGLTDMVPVEEIERLTRKSKFFEIAPLLLDAALDGGGRDNITVLVCRVRE